MKRSPLLLCLHPSIQLPVVLPVSLSLFLSYCRRLSPRLSFRLPFSHPVALFVLLPVKRSVCLSCRPPDRLTACLAASPVTCLLFPQLQCDVYLNRGNGLLKKKLCIMYRLLCLHSSTI